MSYSQIEETNSPSAARGRPPSRSALRRGARSLIALFAVIALVPCPSWAWINHPPIANAGNNLGAPCTTGDGGKVFQLDGTGSLDPDGDPLVFFWSSPGIDFDNPGSPTPSAFFPAGSVTEVTLTVIDPFGASSQDQVHVTMVVPYPDLTIPDDFSVECNVEMGARVTYSVEATDACFGDPILVCTPASGSVFPVGTTTVTCYATNPLGQFSNATFDITVVDQTPPEVDVPANFLVLPESEDGRVVSFLFSASDCQLDPISPIATPPSGSRFPIGTTTVEVKARDLSGNESRKQFSVTVISPNEIRAGNVNLATGAAKSVLFVNGSAGTGSNRTVHVNQGDPLVLKLDTPPSLPQAKYAVYVWKGDMSLGDAKLLQALKGAIGLPLPLHVPRKPQAVYIANGIGQESDLGLHNWPGEFPSDAPVELLNVKSIPVAGEYYLQGIIEDLDSPSGSYAITNGIHVVVNP